jgi:hypothetical protein
MTMKLIDILNEDSITQEKIINDLKGLEIPFEYGTIIFDSNNTEISRFLLYYNTNNEIDKELILPIHIDLNKFGSDMFDKAYLAFSQKIQSLYGNQYDMANIKLKCDRVYLDMKPVFTSIGDYLSVSTKNTLRYEKPSVEKILKGDYHVEVNMDLLPHITDGTYDMVKKIEKKSKTVFKFLQNGTLSNGTSYKLIFIEDELFHDHKERSGRHLDYSDINIEIYAEINKDFPLTKEERDEVKRKFKMYDVDLKLKRT